MPDDQTLDKFHRLRNVYESHLRRAYQADEVDSREMLVEAVREFLIAAGQAEMLAAFVHGEEDLCRQAFTSPTAWTNAAMLDRAAAIGKLGDLVEAFQVETLSDYLTEVAP